MFFQTENLMTVALIEITFEAKRIYFLKLRQPPVTNLKRSL